jgi:hypothetical protein
VEVRNITHLRQGLGGGGATGLIPLLGLGGGGATGLIPLLDADASAANEMAKFVAKVIATAMIIARIRFPLLNPDMFISLDE